MPLPTLNLPRKEGGDKEKYLWLLLVLLFSFLLLFINPGTAQDKKLNTDGAWFLCEYAHSKIPPSDGCAMLDDDGFLVRDGVVYHVKITNSRETDCRGGRSGNCLRQVLETYRAELHSIGPIEAGGNQLSVRFFGCTQLYDVIAHDGYMELRPDTNQCYWTPDKRYFLSRFQGDIEFDE